MAIFIELYILCKKLSLSPPTICCHRSVVVIADENKLSRRCCGVPLLPLFPSFLSFWEEGDNQHGAFFKIKLQWEDTGWHRSSQPVQPWRLASFLCEWSLFMENFFCIYIFFLILNVLSKLLSFIYVDKTPYLYFLEQFSYYSVCAKSCYFHYWNLTLLEFRFVFYFRNM